MELKANRQGLVWGSFLTGIGILALLENYIDLSAWVWIAALAVAGFGFYSIYRTDRSDQLSLIPAYVVWAIALMVALITLNILQDEGIATYVLAAIALPFLRVFLRDRGQWWALIPAYVLLVIGVMVGLIGLGVLDDLLIPAYVMFAIAIPFFVVYTHTTAQWWALIPGGVMAVIGLSFLLAEAAAQYIGPVLLVVAGVWILVRQVIGKKPAVSTPEIGEPSPE